MRKTKEGKDEEYGIAADIYGKLYSAYPLYELAFERETDRAGEQIPLLLSSLLLIDMTYISACNIKENKVLSLFCGLLAMDGWYVLLSFEENMVESFVYNALSPIVSFRLNSS